MPYTYDQDREDEKARVRRFAEWDEALSPDEQEQAEEEARLAIVEKLGANLLNKRKEAIDARHMCGIEKDWQEDEEFYQAIDSANPEGETNVAKPISADGGPIGMPDSTRHAQTRSSVFIPLTRPYVDAAHARIADMLLPMDDWPFKFKPTPITTQQSVMPPQPAPQPLALNPIVNAAGPMAGAQPMPMAANVQTPPGVPQVQPNPGPAAPGMPGMGGQQSMPGPASAIQGNPAAAQNPQPSMTQRTAEEIACEKAEKRIQDWLTECGFHGEYRKMLENAAKLGTGIMKGPVPVIRVSQRVVTVDGVKQLQRVEEVVPASFSIDPRNFFPDPGCGEDVQRGSYVWEFDTLSHRAVQDLKMDGTFILAQIEKVLKEGPNKTGAEVPQESPAAPSVLRTMGSTYPVWYFHGMVERDALEAAGVPEDELPEEGEAVQAVVTIINDTVVKCALSPLDTGGFPYDVMPWQRRAGMIWGMGVARQMRTPQRILNGAARAMMDNAGFTSGPLWAMRKNWIQPIDGKATLTPRKGFYMTDKAPENAKIGDAISFTNVQAAQAEMQAIIAWAKAAAEDATGLPMLLQGQQGAAPDTVGGMQILNNNGSTVLRRIARQSDDFVMEPHIRRYYTWLLENTDYDDEKGDFQIDCTASTALVDRQLENQTLINLAPILLQDPDVHPSRFRQELLKAHRFDPKRIYMTDAEKAQRDAQPKQAPPMPQVEAAKIREQGATERLQATLQFQADQANQDRELRLAEMESAWHELMANIAAGREELTETNKVKLFQMTQDIAMQREALSSKVRAEQMKPPTEPPGRAAPGMAFTQ